MLKFDITYLNLYKDNKESIIVTVGNEDNLQIYKINREGFKKLYNIQIKHFAVSFLNENVQIVTKWIKNIEISIKLFNVQKESIINKTFYLSKQTNILEKKQTHNDSNKSVCIESYLPKIINKNSSSPFIIEDIFEELSEELLELSDIETIRVVNFTFTIFSKDYPSSNESNISIFSLGECETILRTHYQISSNDKLFIIKSDTIDINSTIHQIEYKVYDSNSKELDAK